MASFFDFHTSRHHSVVVGEIVTCINILLLQLSLFIFIFFAKDVRVGVGGVSVVRVPSSD